MATWKKFLLNGDVDLDAHKTAIPLDHPDLSATMAKLAQEVQDLINGALQKSGGTMTGDLTIKKNLPILSLDASNETSNPQISFIHTDTSEFTIRLTPNGQFMFMGDLLPEDTEEKNIGHSDFRWLNGYFGGNLIVDGTVDGVDVSERHLVHEQDSEPTVAAGKEAIWHDTANAKWYHIWGTSVGNKKVELA